MDVFACNLEAIEALGFALGAVTSVVKLLLRFSLAILSEAAKNARTWEMKWRLVSDSLTQSERSAERSISSAVQKEASAFLFIRQMSAWWMGKSTKRCGFSCRSGSGARSPTFLAILCFNGILGGLGVFLAFLVVWAVLVKNLSQSSLLLQMKLLISRKA